MHTTQQHRRISHALRAAPLLLCVLLIAGCTPRFFYNRLDTLASWYFESLVSLNDGQRDELHAWLERTLTWHRESELDRYAQFVSDVSSGLDRPRDPNAYDAIRLRFQGLLHDLIVKTTPDAAELLLHLSPQQVDELFANLADKTAEGAKKSAAAVAKDKWKPKQTKDLVRQARRWAGSVTPEQKRIIASAVEQLEPTYMEWADSQRAWQQALRDALATPAGADPSERTNAHVLELLQNPDRAWTAAYEQKVARNRQRYLEMAAQLDASLSDEQREHMRKQLSNLSQQLHHLARG